jgi:hypothetical protein
VRVTVVVLVLLSLVAAGWMGFAARRSAGGRMGTKGPGIRVPATTVCEHTWVAAQRAASPLYTRVAASMLVIAAAVAGLGALDVPAFLAVPAWLVLTIGAGVFFLGVASVRARKAAEAVRCEHQRPAAKGRRGTRR